MSSKASLCETLRSFVLWKADGEVVSQLVFAWPTDLLAFRSCFKGYTWALSTGPASSRVFGIRCLDNRPAYKLSEMEAEIMEPRTLPQSSSIPPAEHIDQYLIVELLGPEFARVNLAILFPPSDWYLLDEHLLKLL